MTKARQFLHMIEQHNEKSAQNITLTYANPGSQSSEPVDLADVAAELRDLLAAGEHGNVQVMIDLPPDLRVLGNPDQLRQVLWNLVLNAIQAQPRDDRVVVRGQRSQTDDGTEMALLSVADRGRGIPPEIRDRIFDPFFTTKRSGTGLGLATVHRLIEAHGGHLEIESEAGEGTEIRVALPLAAEKLDETSQRPSVGQSPT